MPIIHIKIAFDILKIKVKEFSLLSFFFLIIITITILWFIPMCVGDIIFYLMYNVILSELCIKAMQHPKPQLSILKRGACRVLLCLAWREALAKKGPTVSPFFVAPRNQ